jgi:hypothetical protein
MHSWNGLVALARYSCNFPTVPMMVRLARFHAERAGFKKVLEPGLEV